MKKFDRLLEKIKDHSELTLDLTDFGLQQGQIETLVIALNNNDKIKILCLRHNSLNDASVPDLVKLKNIEFLDICYNNFTQNGIDRLNAEFSNIHLGSFWLYSQHNNIRPVFF